MREVRNAVMRLFVVGFCLTTVANAQGQGGATTKMAPDWTERQDPSAALQAHDFKLLGDAIDLQSGRLSFEQVDVSLPGNFALPVEIRRRLNPSQMQAGEFADWQLAIPTISTTILDDEWYANKRWGKTRCTTSNLASAIPNASWPTHLQGGAALPPAKWNNGVILDVPGRSTGQILDKTVPAAWHPNAKKVTVDGWYLECLTNIDGAGTEGFVAVAPNGDRYKFDVILDAGVKRSEYDVWEVWSDPYVSGPPNLWWQEIGVHYDTLAASEVTDVNGNKVTYEYATTPGTIGKKLIGISASDGRHIDIARTNAYISSVTVKDYDPNPLNRVLRSQRQWTYSYAGKSVTSYKPPDIGNGAPGTRSETWSTLSSVTLPNSRQWLFDLANLQVRPVPGISYGGYQCKQLSKTVSVTHPDGVTGTYALQEIGMYLGAGATGDGGAFCPNTNQGATGSSQYTDVMAVTSKTLSGAGMPTSTWQYSYVSPGSDPIVTTVKQPDNSKRVSYFPTPFNFASPRVHARITKEEIYATTTSLTPMDTKTYTYVQEPDAGSNFLSAYSVQDTFRPVRVSETKLTRGSDWYKTTSTYVTSRTSATYSYGFPTHIEQVSSLGSGTRVSDIVYNHDLNLWILGQTSSLKKNGKLFDEYSYDSFGHITQHKRFGDQNPWKTYTYYPASTTSGYAGALNTITDALHAPDTRTTTLGNWWRGTPKDVDRADGYTLHREVNDYGWITAITDFNGQTTNYDYDNQVGRLVGIRPPAPWNGTTLEYSYPSGALVLVLTQSATPKVERVTTTYDAMLRPTQILSESLTSQGGNIYVNDVYDAMGRNTFSSLPSDLPGSTNGIQTTFDALGRVTRLAETASGGGATDYAYLSGNKIQVTDPLGYQTVSTASGFGGPGDGNIIRSEKPEGIVIDFGYDIYGNQTSIAQLKSDGTQLVSSFEYDSHLLVCRKQIPETGTTLLKYDEDYELIGYAEGQASTSGCPAPPIGSAINLVYDKAGRLKDTDYPGSTPDIYRTFDPNGNLKTLNRGGVNWTYGYTALNVLAYERLELDGRSYETSNIFDPNGALMNKTYPSGRVYDYENDGHFRPSRIAYGVVNYLNVTKYHPNGKVETLTRGNGGTYQQGFNGRDLVSSLASNWGPSFPTIVYDLRGQISSMDSTNNSYDRTYTYDGVGRMRTSTGPWGAGTYSYDTLNNITKRVEGPTPSTSRTVENRYTVTNLLDKVMDSSKDGGAWRTYTPDMRGNILSEGSNHHTFTYDFANQPITIGGADTGSFAYDGNLKRAKQTINGRTIYSFYDRSGAILTRDEVTGTRQVTDFINLSGQTFVRVTNGVPSYPLNDLLGTAYMVADQNGAILASNTYNYLPFGEAIGSGSQNKQGFTGHIEDETGLTYMQARYYDPVTGRFLSPDPIGYAEDLNLYAYVRNDPVNKLDPDGKTCKQREDNSWYCTVDFWINWRGIKIDRQNFTKRQQASVAAFEAAYTKAVNKLIGSTRQSELIMRKTGQSVNVSADKVGNALKARNIGVNNQFFGGSNPQPNGMGTPAGTNTTWIGPAGLTGSNGLADGPRGGTPEERQEIEITHEGMHGDGTGTDAITHVGPPSDPQYKDGWDKDHQKPYNDTAKDLLGL